MGRRGRMLRIGMGVLVGDGWVEDTAELGDEGKAVGCVPPTALLLVLRSFNAEQYRCRAAINPFSIAPAA